MRGRIPSSIAHSTLPAADCERLQALSRRAAGRRMPRGFLKLLPASPGCTAKRRRPCRSRLYRPARPLTSTRAALVAGCAGRGASSSIARVLKAAQTAPVDALIAALAAARHQCAAALRHEPQGCGERRLHRRGIRASAARCHPQRDGLRRVVGGGSRGDTPFAPFDCPVLQVVFAGSSEAGLARQRARPRPARSRHECRAAGARRPHHDARRLLQGRRHGTSATQCRIVTYRPVARPHRLRRRPGGGLGRLAPHARRQSGASRSCSPTIRTRTAASPTASATTRRRARSRSCGR